MKLIKISVAVYTVCFVCFVDHLMADEVCYICNKMISEEQRQRQLECEHIFHAECIVGWVQHSIECPRCVHVDRPLMFDAMSVLMDSLEPVINGEENVDTNDLLQQLIRFQNQIKDYLNKQQNIEKTN